MIEQAEGAAVGVVHPDVEGDVFVHRVPGLRVMAYGVLGAHTKTAEFLVEMSRLLAEAVEVVPLPVHAGVVGESAQVVLFKCPLGQIAVEGLARLIKEPEGEGLFQ